MKTFQISRAYNRMKPAELLTFSSTIRTNLSAKPRFTEMKPLSDALSAACEACFTADAVAGSTGKAGQVVRESRLVDLRAQLEKIAIQFELTAALEQDETGILELGFSLRGTGKPRSFRPLGAAEILTISRDKSAGAVKGKCRKIPGVVKFALEWSDDNGQNWHNGTYSRGNTFLMNGLAPEKRYWIRARPLGTNNRYGNWSEPVTLFVL